MRKITWTSLFLFVTGLLPLAAHAEFGLGAIGSYHASDSYDMSGNAAGETISGKSSSAVGALLFLPVFPEFSLRFGAEYEQLKLTDTVPGFAANDITYSNLLIPLNLQFNLPATDLYFFGGGILVYNQGRTPSTLTARNDVRMNLGIGYSFLTLGPAKLSLEVEYQKGTENMAPTSSETVKLSSLAVNLMARFTL